MPQEAVGNVLSPELSYVEEFAKLDGILSFSIGDERERVRQQLIDTTLAYVKEFDFTLDAQPPEKSDYFDGYNGLDYDAWAREFESAARQLAIRFKLRQQHGTPLQPLRAVMLDHDQKAEIHNLVSKIKKCLNLLDLPETKRSELFEKLNAFACEVDQLATKKERLFEFWLSITKVAGEGVKNLSPVTKLIENIGGIISTAPEQGADALSAPKEPKSLPAPDDDVPF